jgi:putative ATPase
MHEFGYGKGYRYAHSEPGHVARGMDFLPEGLEPGRYYKPGSLGKEGELAERLRRLREE